MSAWRNDLRSASIAQTTRWNFVRIARWPRGIHTAIVALAIGVGGGCSQSSRLARSSNPPTGARPDPFNVTNTYPTGNRAAAPPNLPAGPIGAQAGQFNQAMRPTGQMGPPVNRGQAAGPEMIAAPRPDIAGPGQPAMQPCPPNGQGPRFDTMPPAAKPVRKWRGFLPAQDTDEDRPGWWTPDYGGGTSA